MEKSYLTLKRILHLQEVPFTNYYLKDTLDSHPEPESLLAISDTLAKYKIDSLAVQISEEKLDQMPLPCIVQISGDAHPFFSCLTEVSQNTVEYLDLAGKNRKIPRNEFVSRWTGVTLIVEKGENSAEPGYKGRRKGQLIYRSLFILLGIVGIVWVVGILSGLSGDLFHSIGSFSLFTFKSAGLVISAILLWSEVDKDNSAIKEFCTGGKNVDCNTVIGSYSIGGLISLSNLAFAYFFSGFFLLVLTSFSGSGLQLLSYLSLAGLFIVPVSIYYQGIKIKKWCVLCLWISAVLVLEVLVSQLLFVNLGPLGLSELALFSLLFTGAMLAWLSLKPYLLAKNELQSQKRKLGKFLLNREVFDYFLSGSRKLTNNPEGLGILLKGQKPIFQLSN